MYETTKQEKALLVMVEVGKERWPQSVLAEEFKNLVASTGIEVRELVIVNRKEITPALYIGKGKVEELSLLVQEKNIDVVIFNNDLHYAQQRNLEDTLLVKTIDRTQLILDIFSQHAHTQEGMLQVELAQLEYLLPRLKGKGIMLSRLGAGIGTRGPGEKKLEIDRRRITDRITRLKNEINQISQHRDTARKKREKENIFVCSLVGYTSAGKTTLFNSLTQSDEKISGFLFTTLDTISHAFSLHNNLKVVLSDTVGFLYKLPLNLIEAFKATLEELRYADILLHVIDAHASDITRLRESVDSVLRELELSNKYIILVFNKIDLLSDQELSDLKQQYPEAVFISALQKINLDIIKEKIYGMLFKDMTEVILKFPFKKMEAANLIHKTCEVLKTTYQENEVVYWVRVRKDRLPHLKRMGIEVSEI